MDHGKTITENFSLFFYKFYHFLVSFLYGRTWDAHVLMPALTGICVETTYLSDEIELGWNKYRKM